MTLLGCLPLENGNVSTKGCEGEVAFAGKCCNATFCLLEVSRRQKRNTKPHRLSNKNERQLRAVVYLKRAAGGHCEEGCASPALQHRSNRVARDQTENTIRGPQRHP